jgi:hypothetical protein
VVSVQAIKDGFARVGSSQKELVNVTDAADHLLAGFLSHGTDEFVIQKVISFLEKNGIRNGNNSSH